MSESRDVRLLQAAKEFCEAHRAAMAIKSMWRPCSEQSAGSGGVEYYDGTPRCDLGSPDEYLCGNCLQRKKTQIGYKAMIKDRARSKAKMLRAAMEAKR